MAKREGKVLGPRRPRPRTKKSLPESPLSSSLSSLSSSSDSDSNSEPKRPSAPASASASTASSPAYTASKPPLGTTYSAPSPAGLVVFDDMACGNVDRPVSTPPGSASVATAATTASSEPGTVLAVDATHSAAAAVHVRLPQSALVDADLYGVGINVGGVAGSGAPGNGARAVPSPSTCSALCSPESCSCSRGRDLRDGSGGGALFYTTSSSTGNAAAAGTQQALSCSSGVASGVGSPLTELFASGLYNGLLSDALQQQQQATRPQQSFEWPAAPDPSASSHELQTVSATSADAESVVSPNVLQRRVNPRARQEADRSLVTHVLRVERSSDPQYDLRVTTESICSNLVRSKAGNLCWKLTVGCYPTSHNLFVRMPATGAQTSSVAASVPRLSDGEFVELLAHVQRAALEMTRPMSRAEYAAMPRHPYNAVEFFAYTEPRVRRIIAALKLLPHFRTLSFADQLDLLKVRTVHSTSSMF